MASVKIEHTWADGEITSVVVAVAHSFPDCLDEARTVARQAFADAVSEVRRFEGAEDDAD